MDESFVRRVVEQYKNGEEFTAFDIGANVGRYTTPLAGLFKTVYAFEACEETRVTLRKNIEENKITNVIITEEAVSDVDGEIKLYLQNDNPTNKGGNSISFNVAKLERWGHKKDRFRLIPGITLDTFCEKNNITNLKFIKMDIEGAEDFVWKGAIKTLTSNQLYIMLEVHRCVNLENLYNFFTTYGYKFFDRNLDQVSKLIEDTHYLVTNIDDVEQFKMGKKLVTKEPVKKVKADELLKLRITPPNSIESITCRELIRREMSSMLIGKTDVRDMLIKKFVEENIMETNNIVEYEKLVEKMVNNLTLPPIKAEMSEELSQEVAKL